MRDQSQIEEPEALLREAQAAEFLSLSVRTLQAWRVRGYGPRFCAAGRAIRYRRSELIAWIEANTVSPTDRRKGVAQSKGSG